MFLIGASGHGKVILDILERRNIKVDGFFDKDESIEQILGYKVFPESKLSENDKLLISVGNNHTRKMLAERFNDNVYLNAVHPLSTLDKTVELGTGIAIMAGVIINAESKIGDHVIINTSASVDHDCIIGDFVHIAPNASLCGGITVGEATLIGAGSTIIPNLTIGKNVVIGAGSVVINDIPDNVMVAGNPARIIKNI